MTSIKLTVNDTFKIPVGESVEDVSFVVFATINFCDGDKVSTMDVSVEDLNNFVEFANNKLGVIKDSTLSIINGLGEISLEQALTIMALIVVDFEEKPYPNDFVYTGKEISKSKMEAYLEFSVM